MKRSNSVLARTIAAVLLTGAVSHSAHAAIANGANAIGGGSGSSGELFLNVWDETAATSYSVDLGVTVEQLLTNPSARSWTLDQRFKDFAASGNALSFNLAAGNTYGTVSAGAVGIAPAGYGVLTSVLNDAANLADIAKWNGKAAGSPINAMQAAVSQRANYVSLNATALAGLNANDTANTLNYALNLSETTSATADTYGSYFTNLWGENSSNKFGVTFTAAKVRLAGVADQTVALYFLGLQAPNVNKMKATDVGGGSLVVSLDPTTGTLRWAAPTAVPVPAAVWLFLSALGAMGVINKPGQSRRV